MAKYPFKNCDSMANTQNENAYMFRRAAQLGLETEYDYYNNWPEYYLNNGALQLDSHWSLHTDASALNNDY